MNPNSENAPDTTQLLIRLPGSINAALEADSKRCHRSNAEQLEAILTEYYQVYRGDLQDLQAVRDKLSPGLEDPGSTPITSPESEDDAPATTSGPCNSISTRQRHSEPQHIDSESTNRGLDAKPTSALQDHSLPNRSNED